MALSFSDEGSSGTTGVSSFSFTPTQANGDVFVVHMVLGDSGRTISAPSGWSAQYNTGGPEGGQQHAIFTKQVNGSEPTPFTFSWTGGSSNAACTALRVHSSTGTVTLSDFTVSSTSTDGASPYTTASITADGGFIIYGVGGEGTSSSSSFSQAHGDTEIADVTTGSGTGEACAVYRSSGTHSGSVSKTMSSSVNDRFAATWWIAEVNEETSGEAADAGTATASVTVNGPTVSKGGSTSAGTASLSVTANSPTTTKVSSASAGHASVETTFENLTVEKVSDTIQQVGSATTDAVNNGDTLSIAKPTGVQEDDVLILTLTQNENTITASGFTLLREVTGGETTNSWSAHIYYKVCGDSEPSSYSITHNGGTTAPFAGIISAWRGVNTDNPINVSAESASSGASEPASGPTVTTTLKNRRICVRGVRVISDPAATFSSVTSGWNELAEAAGTSSGTVRYSICQYAREHDDSPGSNQTTAAISSSQTETDNGFFHVALEAFSETDASAGTATPSTTANKPTSQVKVNAQTIG